MIEGFGPAGRTAADRRRIALRALFVTLAAVLGMAQLVPLAFVGLTEGFQSMTVALAADVAAGHGLMSDLAYPFNAEFYYVSRYGLIAVLSLFQPWLLHHLAAVITLLMIAVLILYVVTTLIFVRHVVAAKIGWSMAAIALCPVIAESAYSLNDSLPAAALVTTALALWSARPRFVTTAAAGIALGIAISLRFDSAFTIPGFVALAWWRDGISRLAFVRVLTIGIVALAVASAVYATGGLTIIDPLLIGRAAIALWSEPVSLVHPVKVLSVAFTLAAWLAAGWGAATLWRQDRRLVSAVIIAVAGYLIPYAASLYQPRYLLPIAPFIVALAAIGMRAAFVDDRRWRRAASLGAASLLVLLPAVGGQSEGPRAATGNLWNAFGWVRWLSALRYDYDLALTDTGAAAATGTTIVSTGWSEERLAHLALVRAGYMPLPLVGTERCALARQLYRRGAQTVAHIRLDVPFTGATAGAVNDYLVAPCWRAWGGKPSRLFLISAVEPEAPNGLLPWLVRGAGPDWRPHTAMIDSMTLEARLPDGKMTADRHRNLMSVAGDPPLLRLRPIALGTPYFLRPH